MYATRFECDSCGKVELVPSPESHWEQPIPIGWTPYTVGNAEGFVISLMTGRRIRNPDICPECSCLPYQEIIRNVIERNKET